MLLADIFDVPLDLAVLVKLSKRQLLQEGYHPDQGQWPVVRVIGVREKHVVPYPVMMYHFQGLKTVYGSGPRVPIIGTDPEPFPFVSEILWMILI